ncbi:MAG: restriction endonuclease, SacI family, partial [Allobaculum sp.]|nr:restriction endonuclease, SacI family [Allobaculum sp.]
YDLMYSKFSTIKTEIHKGISDLDVFQNGIHKVTNVLQDGPYSEIDVRQAAYKAIKAGSDQMFFIQGIHGKSTDYSWILKLTDYYLSLGLLLDITSIESFARMRLMLIPNPDTQRFVDYIRKLAQEEKFKSETIERIDALSYDILEMHR